MMAYVGPTSNVRVERVSCEWFGKDAALAELITLFEKSVNNASRAEDDRKLIETNDDNNNFHGIEVLLAFLFYS
jgi:DNA mismatch repair protein MSH3